MADVSLTTLFNGELATGVSEAAENPLKLYPPDLQKVWRFVQNLTAGDIQHLRQSSFDEGKLAADYEAAVADKDNNWPYFRGFVPELQNRLAAERFYWVCNPNRIIGSVVVGAPEGPEKIITLNVDMLPGHRGLLPFVEVLKTVANHALNNGVSYVCMEIKSGDGLGTGAAHKAEFKYMGKGVCTIPRLGKHADGEMAYYLKTREGRPFPREWPLSVPAPAS